MTCRRARSGFTLVELVMVLAVLALLAGIAVPRYSAAATRYRVKAAAHRIAADIALARATARSRSAVVSVKFAVGTGGYVEISGLAGLDSPSGTYRTMIEGDPYRVELKSADFGGLQELVFSGYGVGTTGEVSVSAGGWVCSVQVDGNSGACRVYGP